MLIEGHQLAVSPAKRLYEQPALQFAPLDPVMEARGPQATPQFIPAIFKADNQHAAPLEHVFARERALGRER